jgi:uncharacterized protein (TIGR02145 family)
MKSNNLNRAFFFLGLFALTILLSCSKRNNSEPQPDEVVKPKPETAVKSDSTVLLPAQTVTFELTSSSQLKDTLNATVGGKSFVLYKIEGNKYGGTLPVIPEGTHNVSIPSLALKSPVTVSVAAYMPIADPKPVIESFQTSLNRNIDSLVVFSHDSPDIDIEFIKSLQAQIQDLLKKLTPSEQIELAYAIKALNLQTGGALNPLSVGDKYNFASQQALPYPYTSFERPKIAMGLDAGDRLVKIGEEFVKMNLISLSALTAALASITAIPYTPPPYKFVPAVTAMISITAFVVTRDNAAFKAERIGNLEGIAEFIFEYPTQSINQPKIFSTSNAVAPLLTFKPGIEKPISVPMTFRSVTTQDAQHPSSLLRGVVNGEKDLLAGDKKIEAEYNSITKYLPLVKAYKKYYLRIPAVAKKADMNAPAANLSITKVSDPEIKLAVVKSGDQLKITATSSTIKSVKDFTFDVTYKNEGLNITLTRTFSAVYDGADETMVDIDGNVYATIKIGDNIWTKTNLRTTRYRNGDAITKFGDINAWLTSSGYYPANIEAYGNYYNQRAVLDSRNIAPKGWHIATNAEYSVIFNTIGWAALKSKTTDWNGTNVGAQDYMGFSARPTGHVELKDNVMTYFSYGQIAAFYYITADASEPLDYVGLNLAGSVNGLGSVYRSSIVYGMPVRCVKDR